MIGNVLLQVVTDTVGVPVAAGQQVLKSVRSGVAGPLGKLPAVLAAHRAEQPAHVVPHPVPGLHTGETGSGPQEELFEFALPYIRCRIVDHDNGLLAQMP